jgi:hypothetical protein
VLTHNEVEEAENVSIVENTAINQVVKDDVALLPSSSPAVRPVSKFIRQGITKSGSTESVAFLSTQHPPARTR